MDLLPHSLSDLLQILVLETNLFIKPVLNSEAIIATKRGMDRKTNKTIATKLTMMCLVLILTLNNFLFDLQKLQVRHSRY